jgi:putative sugar O-methyltransferase
MRDQPDLLELLLGDLAGQPEVWRPGSFWCGYADRIARAVRSEGLPAFRSSAGIGRGYAEVFDDDPAQMLDPGFAKTAFTALRRLPPLRALVARYDRILARRNREAHHWKNLYLRSALGDWLDAFRRTRELPDTCVGQPARRLSFRFGEVGELYLRVFAWIDAYSKHVDFSRVRSVLEIGGGFGAMAHAVLHFFPSIRRYAYVDIPPLLYVGTQYLEHFFGDEVVDYRRTRDSERIRFAGAEARQILALCPWQLPKLDASFDFFWNSSSFQEMPLASVRSYAGQLDGLLSPDARLGLFVYDSGGGGRTLSDEVLIGTLAERGFLCEPIDAPIARCILPGTAYLGRRAATPRA